MVFELLQATESFVGVNFDVAHMLLSCVTQLGNH